MTQHSYTYFYKDKSNVLREKTVMANTIALSLVLFYDYCKEEADDKSFVPRITNLSIGKLQ